MASPSPDHEQGRLQSLQPALIFRSRVLSAIRKWFEKTGFIEVETPVRLPTPALELHIDAEPAGAGFLRTSPELHMKRLLGKMKVQVVNKEGQKQGDLKLFLEPKQESPSAVFTKSKLGPDDVPKSVGLYDPDNHELHG